MISCTRRIQFCAGHRVMGHENKCAHVHGHNYVVLITAESDDLDDIGRVIDFSVLKEKVGGWIDRHWDHGFIYNQHDTFVLDGLIAFAVKSNVPQKMYCLDDNPTAENMADHLLHEVCPSVLKDTGVVVTHIRVWETENCYADATLQD